MKQYEHESYVSRAKQQLGTASKYYKYMGEAHQGMRSTMAQNRAQKAPTVYWPEAPMLNRPVLKAKATARPVIMSGAAW